MPPPGQVALGLAHPEAPQANGSTTIAGNVHGARTDLELRNLLNENRHRTVLLCFGLTRYRTVLPSCQLVMLVFASISWPKIRQ